MKLKFARIPVALSALRLVLAVSTCPMRDLACREMSEGQLNDCRGVSACPQSGGDMLLLGSCQECPPGLCRRGTNCWCTKAFLSSLTEQRKCAESYGVEWPKSVTLKNIDRRKCRVPLSSMPKHCLNMHCCELTEDQLNECRGFHKSCPGG